MKKLEIAIRELAYFVCQSGNLTTEFFSNRDLDLANNEEDVQYVMSLIENKLKEVRGK